MDRDELTLSQAALRLPTSAVLGIKQLDVDELEGVRVLQRANFGRRAVTRLALNALAAIVVTGQFVWLVNPLILSAWTFLLAATLVYGLRNDRLVADAAYMPTVWRNLFRQCSGAVLQGVVWSFALLYFPTFGGFEDQLVVWVACSLLVLGSILARAAVPLGSIVFAVIISSAAMISFANSGHYIMIGAVLAFAVMCVVRSIDSSRAFLAAMVAEAQVTEKSEVVSLLLREHAENEADWLWEIDGTRRLCSVSPRFAYALGSDPQVAKGKPFLSMISHPEAELENYPPSLKDLVSKLHRQESFTNLMVKVWIEGGFRWWELSGTPIRDERGRFMGYRGVGSDVTVQRESSEKIAYLARYDTLTSLPNRLMLTENLREAIEDAGSWNGRCALLMIDLDRFKSINDSLGHLVGDQMLAQVSERLRTIVGEGELCGRLGGDEFAVVVRDARDMSRIDEIAARIIERLSEPYKVDNHILYVGASVGSAIGPKDGRTVEELMRNADLALYQSKDEGGGAHFSYVSNMHAIAEERRQLEVSLRHALERGEFKLQYQPVVDAGTATLLSFEALVRWQSPEHGAIGPNKFVPIAEDTRLIVPIGKWVLQQACVEAARWPSNIRIAVNVSPEQLLDPDFASCVVQALSSSGLAAHRLEIEVTESIFLRDASVARNALEEVMALGCKVALDDFGTGYSSLGYLRKLQFSTIKIDRTFVEGAAEDRAESLAIIRAVVAMADSLGMETTAEGVETAQQVELLRNLGCTKIQGYYFGRPMDAEDADVVVEAQLASASSNSPLALGAR